MLTHTHSLCYQLKNKIHQLRTAVEAAEKNNSKEKLKYSQIGDTCLRMRERIVEFQSQQTVQSLTTSNHRLKKVSVANAHLATGAHTLVYTNIL